MFKLIALFVFIATANALSNPVDTQAQVRSFSNRANQGDGEYAYGYQSTNGIAVEEKGHGGDSATGSYAYYDPAGVPVSVSYVADAFGYRAIGSHIPQPPEIPPYILRALEWIRTHPPAPEVQIGQQRFF